jgi:hypothetical protein
MGKRLWQYPEVTNIDSDDFLLLDNESEGSKCIKANKIGAVLINKTVTERKTYTASDDSVNGYKKVIVDVPYTDVHYEKDDIVSFTGEDFPLKSLTADITAIQDLHGYDYPWVGGAGKNLFDYTHFQFVDMGYINGYGVWEGSRTIKNYPTDNIGNEWNSLLIDVSALRSQNVSFSGFVGSTAIGIIDENFKVLYTMGTSVPTSGSVDLSQYPTAKYFVIGFYFIGYDFDNAQFELGTTVTSFAPYSNICPISGWDEANVSVSGVNVWDEEYVAGYIDANGVFHSQDNSLSSKNYSPVKPNTQLYLVTKTYSTLAIFFYDKNKQFISYIIKSNNTTFTTPDNTYFIKFGNAYNTGATYNNDISINYPSTDTEYHAYNGKTYNIQFTDGDNPLTVYGGTLDVVSGVLTVDRAYVDLGTLNWYIGYGGFIIALNDIAPWTLNAQAPTKLICSAYPTMAYSVSTDMSLSRIASTVYIRIIDSRYTDPSAFKTAMNGVQLVYELATPITYQLSKQQIRSLVGENNVFADTGEVAVEWQTLYQTPSE